MIPLANAIAGVLIGALYDTWIVRLIMPVIWGVAFYGFRWVLTKQQRRPMLPSIHLRGRRLEIKVTPRFEFYYLQFLWSVATAMGFSVVTGFLRDLV